MLLVYTENRVSTRKLKHEIQYSSMRSKSDTGNLELFGVYECFESIQPRCFRSWPENKDIHGTSTTNTMKRKKDKDRDRDRDRDRERDRGRDSDTQIHGHTKRQKER